MEFVHLHLKEEFSIDALVSLHYFEFARDFVSEGERHPFWELLYVDKGEAEVAADENGYVLKQGDLIFHKPDEFHSVWANQKIAPNIVVVSFSCHSKAMEFFENKIFTAGDGERNILGSIVKEGTQAFLPPFDKPLKNTLLRRSGDAFGCEQMLKIHLQTLLIQLVRKNRQLEKAERLSSTARERAEEDVVQRLEKYLVENIVYNLSLEDICSYMNMSRTHLVTLFKKKKGTGVIEFFKDMKIEQAKTFLREGRHNITEIAELLRYNSIHSFSRHFSRVTGMSPIEYAKSIKARLYEQ